MTLKPSPLILASTSVYRRELLSRLRVVFECHAPQVLEDRLLGEQPAALAVRLAALKAAAVAAAHPSAVVIGADQVAANGSSILGKPGTTANAIRDLSAASGKAVDFYTAVTILRPDGTRQDHLDLTRVQFRLLSATEIATYVELDQPLDCAGSFRSEGLGVSLFERIDSHDPTALIGLPLIFVAKALRLSGHNPLVG